jgi:transposase
MRTVGVLCYSLYATKVACTAGKKKATLFLGRIGSGGTRYQSKRRAAVMKKNYRLQDHVVKGKDIFVGLEDSKKTWKLAVRSEKMLIQQVSMEARYPVLIRYLRNKFPECTVHLIYEAGFKGFNLYDQLTEDGIDCVVIPPHVVTEPKVNRVKTDKRDARRLAKVLENHDFKDGCYVPDKERREDRQVSRTLIALQKDVVRTRNRIRKLLDVHGIEVSCTGRWDRQEFRALKKLELNEPLRISLDILLTQLEELWAHQVTLRAALKKLCKKERYHKAFTIARSLPGIGWFTAIRLVLELGEDLSRFGNGKKIASFVGLTPSENSSGETEHRGRITGMGPGFIRAILIENSWIAIRKDPVLLAKFTRVWHASGNRKKAIVAVARMLIVRLRACVMSGTPYKVGIAA